jgi:hypothetical protein
MFDYIAGFAAEEAEDLSAFPRYALRKVEPPLPVEINLLAILPTALSRWGTQVPIRVRAAGIDVSQPVHGLLFAWVLTMTGTWCGICSMELGSRGGSLRIALPRQLIPRQALRRLPAQPH